MAVATLTGVLADGPLADGVPVNTAAQVDWPRGTDGSIDLRLYDNDGNPVDLDIAGGDLIEFCLRSSLGGDPILQRAGTKLTTAVGLYSFAIARVDTIDISNRVILDVWTTRAGSQRQVVSPSYFNVTPRMKV